MGLFSKIKQGLQKTKHSMVSVMEDMLGSFTSIDEELLRSWKKSSLWPTSESRRLRKFAIYFAKG